MSQTVNFCVRIDSDVKQQADALFAELGLSMASAINAFLRQSLREGGLPFKLTTNVPNKATLLALQEAEALAEDGAAPRFYDIEEALRELKR